MRKKLKSTLVLLAIDCTSGRIRRYRRAQNPRWAGDDTQVEVTDEVEADISVAGQNKEDIEKFRWNPASV